MRGMRISKMVVRLLCVSVVGAGVLAGTTHTASAYAPSDCGNVTLHDTDQAKLNTSYVDFGDEDGHRLDPNAPNGSAVVCWEQGRKNVEVIGDMFWSGGGRT